MTERDSEDDERDDLDDDEEESSPPPPKAKPKASAKSGAAARKSVSAAPKPAMVPSSRALAIGIIALAVGGAGGWFGQIQKTKAALRAEGAAAPAGSGVPAGPCGAWQTKICSSAGEQSASCQQAKGATELLVPSTCEAALGTMPATLAKLKAARASCDKLVSKLCADLSPGSKTCDMVKERTPSFPHERCDQMLQSYDKVIAELKQMDQQQGGIQMGGPGGPQMGGPGGPQRMPPGGMPPGGMPHITMPPGVSQP
jgi:hypothetical protein